MANITAVAEGKAALQALEDNYAEYQAALSTAGEFAHGKSYRKLKEMRRQAGKISNALKRCGRPSRFLEAALTSYDYAEARIVGSASLSELDSKAVVCAAAIEVIREALLYECETGALGTLSSVKADERVPECVM